MCFLWRPDVLSLHVVSDALIALSYFCIPPLLLTFARRRPALHLFGWLFSTFIVCCGLTHALDIWTIWHPDYWLSGTVKATTAIASLATLAALLPLMPFGRILGRFSNLDRINRELESQYRSIVESSNDGIWLLNSSARTTFVNTRLIDMLGFDSAELVGTSIGAFVHPDTGSVQRALVTQFGDMEAEGVGGGLPVEVCFRRKDGSPLWTEVRVAPIHGADGNLIGSAATIADATERRRAAFMLAQSELRYRMLAEAMPHGVFSDDADGVADYCNRTLLEYLGVTLAEFRGKGWASTVHPDDRRAALAAWDRALTKHEPFEIEARLRRASDGMYRWFISRATPVLDEMGAVVKWIGSCADIHDFKLAIETRDVLDTMGHIISIRNDGDATFEYISPSWTQYTGVLADADVTTQWRERIHPSDREAMDRQDRAMSTPGSGLRDSEIRVRAGDGSYRWFLARTVALADEDGRANRRINIWTDIEDLKRSQAACSESEARYRALTESVPQLVWISDDQVNIHFVNEGWLAYTGLTFEPGMPSKTRSIIHPDDVAVLAAAHANLRARTKVDCEVRLRRHDGAYRWHLVRSAFFRETPEGVTQWIVSGTDIEARKAAEAALALSAAELAYRAHYDPLTGLANRTRLMDDLARTLLEADRDRTGFIVLYLDLDHFKNVNDTLGHGAGDKLLLEVARRITSALRPEDLASRIGGDEFILVCRASDTTDAAHIAERLQRAIAAPIELSGKQLVVSSSIGMSVFPQHGSSAPDLIHKADSAMYAAKQAGRNAWQIFDPHKPVSAVPDLDFEAELRQAIALEQFVVHYQPILNVASGRPVGAEALVRWLHPTRGLLAPSEFIAFAEDHGLIAQIGGLVLDAACAQLRRLNLAADDEFCMAVNVSARQFGKTGFVETIAAALAAHGLNASRLEIEITESVVMGDIAAVLATLARLRALGVKVSMDDFGTGYSSLSYIKNFAIDTLKIDRSFVADLAISFTDQAIAKAIITLAHSLEMRVIAEGVETLEQLELLGSFDADCFQGYLVSRPLTGADFGQFMTDGATL
jgi:diguanylate cyclase (GGDEF)-like protein/PAS domain S-box-containing protein